MKIIITLALLRDYQLQGLFGLINILLALMGP
jgi:hypothetical protein